MEKRIKNNTSSQQVSTYEIRKSPGTRNVSNTSALKMSSKQPPTPKK